MTNQEFILGPQVALTSSWFDTTQIAKAREHGAAFPATPPVELDSYILAHYYDLGLTTYIAHKRTGDPLLLTYARKVVDSWWQMPYMDEGRNRPWPDTAHAPRYGGIGGLALRAMDGRPEMWDYINSYTRFIFDHWLKARINDPQLFYGTREGAFALHYAAWLAKVLPDTFPLQAGGTETNGAGLRAQYLVDVEAVAVNYFGRLQYADGSWRWNDFDTADPLRGIMQPFMIGLLTSGALCDVHQLPISSTGKTSVATQITKACRHLYSDGPYIKDQVEVKSGVKIRGFHYLYHGGTDSNPTKYVKGDISNPWTDDEGWWLASTRQAISTILPAYGYAYQLTQDSFFKSAGDELYDSAYNGADGYRSMMDGTPKNYNQHARRGASYLAWSGGSVVAPVSPSASPSISPSTSPSPSASPSAAPPMPCTISAPGSVTVPKNSTGIININVSNVSEPVVITHSGSDGQVQVSPASRVATSTSNVLAFQVKVKKQSRTIMFNSPCGSRSVQVKVQ